MLATDSFIVDADELARQPRLPLDALEGISHTVLRTEGEAYAGVMWIAPGFVVPEHVHPDAVHHVWLADGRARVADRVLERSSYLYVPAGSPHSIEGLVPSGCTLFYLYEPEPKE
jgi:quercetin dioxygenase-like cupin family protein